MFAQRFAGHSTAGTARTLNALGVSSPSAHDPVRNPHRSGAAWTPRTVAAILANPRYTGRQVWNRQGVDRDETRPGDKSSRPLGRKPTHRRDPREQWVISSAVVHPPLVSDAVFAQVQQVNALPVADESNANRCQLTGLVVRGLCGRRSEGRSVHGRCWYRYRYRYRYASSLDAQPGNLKTLYVRQDQTVERTGAQLARFTGFDPVRHTAVELAAQLRSREFTIVCTLVSIALDTGTDTAVAVENADVAPPAHLAPEDAARSADVGTELTLFVVTPAPSSAPPRQLKTPTKATRNVNHSWWG
jgi:site-specific DNA recombinase